MFWADLALKRERDWACRCNYCNYPHHAQIHTYIQCIHIHIHVHVHVHIHMHIHTYIQTDIHTYIHIYLHIYIYTYTECIYIQYVCNYNRLRMHVEYVHVYLSTSITGRKIGQGARGNLAKNIGMTFRKNKQVIEEMSLHIYSMSKPQSRSNISYPQKIVINPTFSASFGG